MKEGGWGDHTLGIIKLPQSEQTTTCTGNENGKQDAQHVQKASKLAGKENMYTVHITAQGR